MSEDTEQSQKTEQATEHRLEKAREKGQIAFSKELGHLFAVFGLILIFSFMLPPALRSITQQLRNLIEQIGEMDLSAAIDEGLFSSITLKILFSFMLPILILVAAALAAGFLQTRFLVSFEPLKPQLSKLSPLSGFKKLFGIKALVEFLKSFVKFSVVAVLTYYIVWPEFRNLEGYISLDIPLLLASFMSILLHLLGVIFVSLVVFTLFDYGYQKFMHSRELMMTKQEVKDEMKDVDGDPHVKQRLRRIRSERARNRGMLHDVGTATVVVTNPTHYSIALHYDIDSMDAPVVVAKGVDFLALRIREIAKDHDVPIVENPPLARGLYDQLEVGQQIPHEFYEAVAQVIRYVMNLKRH